VGIGGCVGCSRTVCVEFVPTHHGELERRQTSTVVIEWGEVITEIADDVLAKQNSKGAERDSQAAGAVGSRATASH